MHSEGKKFSIILFASLAIHVAMILLLPGFKDLVLEREDKVLQLKKGIHVNFNPHEKPKKRDFKKENVEKQREEPKEIADKLPEKIKKIEVKEEKIQKEVEKSDKNMLTSNEEMNIEDLIIEDPDFDLLSTEKNSYEKVKKKEIRGAYSKADTEEFSDKKYSVVDAVEGEIKEVKEVVPISKDEVFKKNYSVETKSDGEELKWVTFEGENGTSTNLPEGFRLGTLEEGLIPVWSKSNQEPRYPLEAEKKGMKGKVVVILDVDESGSVRKAKIEKSGYPVLDKAVIEVASTWKIFIYQNGLPVSGKVSVTYDFELIRKNRGDMT